MIIKVYHGSNKLTDKLDSKQTTFTNSRYFAEKKAKESARASTPFLYEVELTLKNVFDVDDKYSGQQLTRFYKSTEVDNFAKNAGLIKYGTNTIDVLYNLQHGKMTLTGEQILAGLSNGRQPTRMTHEKLKRLGYDGIRMNGQGQSMFIAYNDSSIRITSIDMNFSK